MPNFNSIASRVSEHQMAEKSLSLIDLRHPPYNSYALPLQCDLTYVDLLMSDNQGQTVSINALFNTGTQLSIVKEDTVSQMVGESLATFSYRDLMANCHPASWFLFMRSLRVLISYPLNLSYARMSLMIVFYRYRITDVC